MKKTDLNPYGLPITEDQWANEACRIATEAESRQAVPLPGDILPPPAAAEPPS